MVIEFRINLIRGQVPSASERRRRYRLMVLYLGVAGVLLAVAMGSASKRLVEARGLRRQCQEIEDRFRSERGGGEGIPNHARELDQRLAKGVSALRSVERQLATDARPARLVRALALSLPSGVSLRRVVLNGEDQSVLVELLVFGGGAGQDAGASDLLETWSRDAAIADQVKNLAFLGSQLEGNVGRSDMVWRFSGHLKGKGS